MAQSSQIKGKQEALAGFPVIATYNWTGLYVGIQGGVGFGNDIQHRQGVLTLRQVRGAVGAGNLAGTDFRAGWTIGAGVEAAIWQNVSLKLEYLYFDLGRNNYTSIGPISTNAKGHIIRSGLNYRF